MSEQVRVDSDLYTVILRKEESAGEFAWVARVAELPGCAATESSAEDALRHIRESIKTYLEMLEEEKKPIPHPAAELSGRFTVRVPRWVHRRLKEQADAEGISLNHHVASILAFWTGLRQGTPKTARRHVVRYNADVSRGTASSATGAVKQPWYRR